MGERNLLLDAVGQLPDDGVVRLVFADWLEENGEPEASIRFRLMEVKRLNGGSFHSVKVGNLTWYSDENPAGGYPYFRSVVRRIADGTDYKELQH